MCAATESLLKGHITAKSRLHSIHSSTAVVLDESFYVRNGILNFQLAVHSIRNL